MQESLGTINGIPIKDIDVEYVKIVGTSKLFGKLKIEIDFGQPKKFFDWPDTNTIKDKDGKIISFNSMIDAINFMAQNGYKFVNAYTLSVKSELIYHYILRKE